MKNIAIIVPTLNKGGAERVAANMSLEFAKYFNVYVIVHDGRNIIYPYGGTLIDLELPPSGSKIGKVTTLLKRIARLRAIKKKYNIDVSISHLPPSNYANVFSRAGDRVFTYVHCMEKWSRSVALRERLTAFLSDRVICVSECVRRNMIENFGIDSKKAVTVYNFCDLNPKKTEQRTDDDFSIMTMGRLTEQKGQWHLIRATKQVIQTVGEKVRLTVIGDGELRSELERLSNDLGIGQNVTFTGFLDDPWSKLVQGDLYVSSSLWEGLPMALVEAGRCGLPIISTDCDAGCREILAPGTDVTYKTNAIEEAEFGILIPVGDEGEHDHLELTDDEYMMAQSIIRLAQNPQIRKTYAQKAKTRSEDFRASKIMAQWLEILE